MDFPRWDGKRWPPSDRVTRELTDLIDRSPHVDWLTSNQAVAAAEHLREGLAKRGYIITKATVLDGKPKEDD